MSVLDASALLALLFKEPGHESVAVAAEGASASTVNLAEVLTRFVRDGHSVAAVLQQLDIYANASRWPRARPGSRRRRTLSRWCSRSAGWCAREDAAAYVIACFSDPGLHAAREATAKPVFGIAECGLLSALTQGERSGIIAILETSLARHLRYVRQLGLAGRLCRRPAAGPRGGRARGEARTLERMIDIGARLRDDHGADVLVLGCAGMARYPAARGVRVVDLTRAAVTMAIGAVRQAHEGDG